MIKKIIYIVIISVITLSLRAQKPFNFKQTIKGRVVDKSSRAPLVGANVLITDFEPPKGAVTDTNGFYKFEDIPIGKYTLRFSSIGYHTVYKENVNVASGKEVVLNVALEEKAVNIETVTVRSFSRKDRPINDMANISARSFTVEETRRYAGTYGDPARMASNYAGILSARDNINDIIIRGNSSIGLLWRLEGVEIPNPNHFGPTGATGGPISILNNNLLTNSDFLTGAFPAEYGNALAGVFDLRMRNGNNDKKEHWAQIGWNGLEFGTEGPIGGKNKLSSYILSYRYSVTSILDDLNVKLEEKSDYQDLNLKFNFPNTKLGSFSIFGIGGISGIRIYDSEWPQKKWMFENHGEDLGNNYKMGVLGMNHVYYFTKNARLKSSLSIQGFDVFTHIDTFSAENPNPYTIYIENSSEVKHTFSTKYIEKIDARNKYTFGFDYNSSLVSYVDSTYSDGSFKNNIEVTDETVSLIKAYGELQHKFSDNFTGYTGVHGLYLLLNNTYNIEPRLSLEWKFLRNHKISFGTGLHSQVQPKMIYFVQTLNKNGEYELTNKNLDLTKSFHCITGYDYLINKNLRVKLEGYYQYLYDVPVQTSQPAYSVLNEGVDFFIERYDSLVNEGTGENYGIDLTLEKFFSNNYYFLITTSVFESYYTGYDGIKRNTSFNGKYALNLLGGYEHKFKRVPNSINFGINFTLSGGRPYLPYDSQKTVEEGEAVYDWGRAYKPRRDTYKRLSVRIGFERNLKKMTMISALDLQYRSNYTNVYLERINVRTGEVVQTYRMGFYPMASWRIEF